MTITSSQSEPKEGRLHVIFSKSDEQEPRFYSAWPTQDVEPLFSQDLPALTKGQSINFDAATRGFPFASLTDLPALYGAMSCKAFGQYLSRSMVQFFQIN
ncbi:hypothetical protein GNIT_0953 [Glaciecola nitratireducens FR1064]|uniref:Uncharacterized protein n=1 Tax=Glaciecola nitratireducens (strain JCM 12485 / KCTC 12276 / FR1064) TaxID=1085623 RepID=G4QG00_GLANF|nr:hypothetical protein GNIT_0953 [Glaciecola nitratireducens FR1064]